MIPKIIHQTWKTSDLLTYNERGIGVQSQESFKKFFPNYEYKFWTDADIAKYIEGKGGWVKDAFDSIDANIKRMDFFRYLIIEEFGGIYADVYFVMSKTIDLDEYSNFDFIGYKACRDHRPNKSHYPIEDIKYRRSDKEGYWVLGNAFFGAEKNSSKLKKMAIEVADPNNKGNPLIFSGPEKLNKGFVQNEFCDLKTFVFSKDEVGLPRSKIGTHKKCGNWG